MQIRNMFARQVITLIISLGLIAGVPAAAAADPADTLSDFAAVFAAHADALEESFEIPCSPELRQRLFMDSNIPGKSYITNLSANAGVLTFSYIQYPDRLKFADCRYYEGKRILHAWRTGETSKLTAREQATLREAQQMVIDIRGTDLEKEKAIHDLICMRVAYETDPAEGHHECDSAVGAILNGKADCDGYSDAFLLLGGLAGLEIRTLEGEAIPDDTQIDGNERNMESGGHMWNLVRINGRWTMTDVTWDDQEERLYYTYFNTGAAAERKKRVWVPEVMYITPEERTGNDLRPAGLEYDEAATWDEVYRVLCNEAGRKNRICLRYTDELDLIRNRERFGDMVYSAGVQDYAWHFGADSVEIAYIRTYPHYRICSTPEEALDYMEECAEDGVESFDLFFTPDLASALFANDHQGIRELLGRSRLENTGYSYSEETRHITISGASYIPSLPAVQNREDLAETLEGLLKNRATDIDVLLPEGEDSETILDLVGHTVYGSGASGFRYAISGRRLSLTDIEYYPEYRIVDTADEILSYLRDSRERHPEEIRIYCSGALYGALNGDVMYGLMARAGMKQKNLSHTDEYRLYVITAPEWK